MKIFHSIQKFGSISLLGLSLLPGIAVSSWASFTPGYSEFKAICGRENIEYVVQSAFVLPGEILQLEVADKRYSSKCKLAASGCGVETPAPGVWRIHAPLQTGLYPAQLIYNNAHPAICLQIFVLVPFAQLKNQKINGYRMGSYPIPQGKVSGYGRPLGFIEVTAANQNAYVSPHFQLRQFLCKQTNRFPQYMALRPELIRKLEKIYEQLCIQGYSRPTLQLLSGFRTPYYNRMIGDKRLSAHQWGLAADVYLEKDSRASDDLNEDGRVDVRDAEVLFQLVDRWESQPEHAALIGGMGIYAPNMQHGPFVHIDVRGYPARWAEGISLKDVANYKPPDNLKMAGAPSMRPRNP